MKKEYLSKLREYLEEKNVKKEDIEDIISDYDELYDGYFNKGLTDEEIYDKLGKPRDVYKSIKGTLSYFIEKNYTNNKLAALSPFIAVVIFILIGQLTNVYHPTWLVFLIIPLFGVIGGKSKLSTKIVSSSPFIATAAFILLGTFLNLWHPGWLVFLIIPISSLIVNPLKNIVSISLFLGIAASFLLTYFNLLEWKYAWLAMILFLVVASIQEMKKSYRKFLFLIGLLIAIVLYIILLNNGTKILLALLPFLLPFILGIYSETINITLKIDKSKKAITLFIISVLIIAAFIVLGIALKSFAYIWQILLLIPVVAVIFETKEKKFKLSAIMPFIAVSIFFSLGYFYGLWNISWLAFFLIPIAGILDK